MWDAKTLQHDGLVADGLGKNKKQMSMSKISLCEN